MGIVDNSLKICNICVNDASVQGISFNSNGICNYCEEFKKLKIDIENRHFLNNLWKGRIKKYKNSGDYDALVGFSGGKDSTYIIYKLINTYHLKIKAWTLDNGFLTKDSKEKIKDIIDELGIDHQYTYVDQNKLKEIYSISLLATGAPCLACVLMMYPLMNKIASDQNIPMAIHGRSRSQMFQTYSSNHKYDIFGPFLEMGLTPVNKINIFSAFKKFEEILFDLMSKHIFNKFQNFFPDYHNSNTFLTEFISFFLYHEYDEIKIVEYLEKISNWKRPKNYEILKHFDCDAHDAATYLFEKVYQRPFIMPEISEMIREEKLSRIEGLKRLKEEKQNSIPINSLNKLSEITGISVNNLITNSEKFFIKRINEYKSK